MAAEFLGPRTLSADRDEDGYRTYNVGYLVKVDITEGPATALQCPDLPQVGDSYSFKSDSDEWAFCKPKTSIKIHMEKEGDPANYFMIGMAFSTKPDGRCNDTKVENPLLEPMEISGTFVKETKEAVRDRHDNLIMSSSHEQFRGNKVEFEVNRPTVKIKQNVASLELSTFAQMVNCVNDGNMWGLPARCIKLCTASWERKYFGTCNSYYTREFEFDVRFETHDRYILDEGTKVLHGAWVLPKVGGVPDPDSDDTAWAVANILIFDANGNFVKSVPPNANNPQHFIAYKDRHGEKTRVVLNGAGLPARTKIYKEGGDHSLKPFDPFPIKIEFYPEANFFLLNIPTSL